MRTITTCRSCGSEELEEILDLGEQYVSDFREDDSKPSKYPLVALICRRCMLVQLRDTTPSAEMYHENYGFKSGISDSIKADLKSVVEEALDHKPVPKNWLDIASNDGTLLSFVPKWVNRVGVDPIKKLCEEAEQHADLIINDFFSSKCFPGPVYLDYSPSPLWPGTTFDVITSISCFYDMDDPNKFVREVKQVLAPNGVWVIQQNYLLPTMELGAVDNFCHEHLEYYTLLSLEKLLDRHELEIIDCSTSMVNGGSLRTVVAHKGQFRVTESVYEQREIEEAMGLDTLAPYHQFAAGVMENINELRNLVLALNWAGERCYILAASTRGATIWQAAGIDEKLAPYAVERNPAKVGRYFNACGMPIISEEQARADKPNYMLVGPWFFIDEIAAREAQYLADGGQLIVPLPKLRIIRG